MKQLFAFIVFILALGCSSSDFTGQATERNNSDPTLGSGGWSYPNRTWSNGRALGNDAGAGAVAGGTAGRAGFSNADTASSATAGQLPSETRTMTTTSAIGGAANAVGGQPTTVPTNVTAVEPVAVGGAANGGAMSACTACGGSAGTAADTRSMAGVSAFSGGSTSTRVYDGATGPDTPMRVLFLLADGTPKDSNVQIWIEVESRSPDPIPLKNIEIVYWGRMDPLKSIACLCDSAICAAATVGTFRSSHTQANTGFIYAFPGFELQPSKTMRLEWNCHYTDWSAIDETTHYSYPFNLNAGDEMPRVTIQDKSKMQLLWGVLPE